VIFISDELARETMMSDWIDFDRWNECVRMERPGFVFEVKNANGQSLFTPCRHPLQTPWDWKSGPVQFRLVKEIKPRHSEPLPKPQQ
jgi:hypothetical protein